MDARLKDLLDALLALIPDGEQVAALRDIAPGADDLLALGDVPGLPDNLRRAIATFCSAKRGKQVAQLERVVRKLDRKLDLDDPEAIREAVPQPDLVAALKRVLPGADELAVLAGLKGQPKLDPRFVAACCTPGQLARMKQALLPGKTLERMAAAVLTPEQQRRLHASKLPRELVARIEASRPKAEDVARLRAAAERIRAVEQGMLSAKKRARIAATEASQHDLREGAAAQASHTQWPRMEELGAQIIKEVTR